MAALSVVALLLGLLGWWSWFGVVVWLLIFLCTALGYGRDARRRPIRTVLLALLLVNLSLFIAMLLTDRTEGEPFLILGVPLSTAFLVYGIWPMGTLLGVLLLGHVPPFGAARGEDREIPRRLRPRRLC